MPLRLCNTPITNQALKVTLVSSIEFPKIQPNTAYCNDDKGAFMPGMYIVIGIVIGLVAGYFLAKLMTPDANKQKSIQKDLEKSKFELEQQRQELADHFAQTAEMLDVLGKDYTKLYQHMAKTSTELLPNVPEQDNPFVKKIAQHTEEEIISKDNGQEAPKDYAHGATGLLKDQEKEVINTPTDEPAPKLS